MATKTLLKAVQKGYGMGAAPAWVSGHAADGTPLAAPHLACVPLYDAGWRWSAGGLMGLALIPPRALEDSARRARDPHTVSVAEDDAAALAELDGLRRALARQGGVPPRLDLGLSRDLLWRVAHDPSPAPQSLRPRRYLATARLWGTVTPVALDRHPKVDGEMEAGLRSACARIGLPEPLAVVPGKHSAFTGAAPARPSARSPAWTGWHLPPNLAGRRLTHAVLRFAEPVAGPVILGAGRFSGLGLCLPLEEGR
jgi:CRISPR-associated protein Csb2